MSKARTIAGLSVGSNVQAWDGDLDGIAELTSTIGLLKKTAANTWSLEATATQAEKTADTSLATTAFVDRMRSLSTPSTGVSGTLVIGDRGALVSATGAITIPANVFAARDIITIFNNSAASISIAQGASLTLHLVGTATTGNRTLAQRGLATIVFISSTVAAISGGGLT